MTTPKLTPQDLRQFTGTEHWYRHPLASPTLYTDGIKNLADQAGAYWLIDLIAFAQRAEKAVRGQSFQVWTLKVEEDRSALLTATDGHGAGLYKQRLEFTDFPLPQIDIWVEGNVILLPSEH